MNTKDVGETWRIKLSGYHKANSSSKWFLYKYHSKVSEKRVDVWYEIRDENDKMVWDSDGKPNQAEAVFNFKYLTGQNPQR